LLQHERSIAKGDEEEALDWLATLDCRNSCLGDKPQPIERINEHFHCVKDWNL
jgi:hypothetical protein